MFKELDKRKLRFLILSNKDIAVHSKTDYQKAYNCWKEVWGHAFKIEMNVPGPLYSDFYTKQSHVAVLFYGDEVACLTTLNHLDLTDQVDLDDSFFKVWPEPTLREIKNEARKIMACCNVTVNFQFRRGTFDLCWKDLMLAFLVHYLKSTSIDAVVAAVRLEKGMEKSAYRTGAHALAKNLPYSIEGQRVDIVCWPRNLDENLIDPKIYNLVKYVFKNSWSIFEENEIAQGVKNVA